MKFQFSRAIILTFVFLLGFFTVSAQTEREKGIELIKQGKSQEAISSLKKFLKKNDNDAEIWNTLGKVYLETNDLKNSKKAFQKAIDTNPNNSDFRSNLAYVYLLTNQINESRSQLDKAIMLNPSNATAYYLRGLTNAYERKYDAAVADADRAIDIEKGFSGSYIMKSNALVSKFGEHWEDRHEKQNMALMESAVKVLELCVAECNADDKSNKIEQQLKDIKLFYNFVQKYDKPQVSNLPVDSNEFVGIKFISKPHPSYTDSARNARISGTVNLAILFGSDAKIKFVVVIKSLNHGLDAQAIKAANEIQFEPAIRDGQTVSVIKILQYSFRVY